MAKDKVSHSRVAERVVYLLRETYGSWTVTMGTNDGSVLIASVREWTDALTTAVQKACAERAGLLLVDGAGIARWVPHEELRDVAREWGVPVDSPH